MFNSINPANEKIAASFSFTPQGEIEKILKDVFEASKIWSEKSFSERAIPMKMLAHLLIDGTEKYSRLITQEMGKPIVEARAEIKKCAYACSYFADQAQIFLKDRVFNEDKQTSIVSFEPLGVILGIMPWNFPFWQVFRFLAPTLMAGNGIVIKHALNVPGCALAIEELMSQAGFPNNLVRAIFVEEREIENLIKNPHIHGVSLTGSDRAGEAVAAVAGQSLKKCVLELGGSDPFIVLKDANLESCMKAAVSARLLNAGQSCIAAKRFIVEKPLIEEFCRFLIEEVRHIKTGDPMLEETQVGPLARKDLFEKFHRQIQDSIAQGAQLLFGGKTLDKVGYYYPPTILRNVKKGMAAFDEETFGPLFAIVEANDAHHAVEIANDSVYGLGASLWTQNSSLAKELARKIQSGVVFINGMTASDPKYPFGGIKRSGFGRELGEEGIKEFVNIKTIIMA